MKTWSSVIDTHTTVAVALPYCSTPHSRVTGDVAAMLRAEADYPTQTPSVYLGRVGKCSLLLAGSSPLVYGIVIHALRLMGIEHDKVCEQGRVVSVQGLTFGRSSAA